MPLNYEHRTLGLRQNNMIIHIIIVISLTKENGTNACYTTKEKQATHIGFPSQPFNPNHTPNECWNFDQTGQEKCNVIIATQIGGR